MVYYASEEPGATIYAAGTDLFHTSCDRCGRRLAASQAALEVPAKVTIVVALRARTAVSEAGLGLTQQDRTRHHTVLGHRVDVALLVVHCVLAAHVHNHPSVYKGEMRLAAGC